MDTRLDGWMRLAHEMVNQRNASISIRQENKQKYRIPLKAHFWVVNGTQLFRTRKKKKMIFFSFVSLKTRSIYQIDFLVQKNIYICIYKCIYI